MIDGRKCRIFIGKMLENYSEATWEVRENILRYVKEQNLKIDI